MGFAAFAPIIAAGIGAASNASGGKGGGASSSSQNSLTNQRNFLDFQGPFLTGGSGLFDFLGGADADLFGGAGLETLLGNSGRDNLLIPPGASTDALRRNLNFFNLLQDGGGQAAANFQNLETLVNDSFGPDQDFGRDDVRDRLEELFDSGDANFGSVFGRLLQGADQGVNQDFANLLLGAANEDPFSNPFVDRITQDALTDQRAAALDAATLGGNLGDPSFGQTRQREAGRLSAAIRGEFGERSRNRALQAAGTGAQFRLGEAQSELNFLTGAGNVESQRQQALQGVTSGLRGLTQDEFAQRQALVAGRFGTAGALSDLQQAGAAGVPGAAANFALAPFNLGLNPFLNLVSAPLGSVTQSDIARESETGGGKGGSLGSLFKTGLGFAKLFGGGGPLTGAAT